MPHPFVHSLTRSTDQLCRTGVSGVACGESVVCQSDGVGGAVEEEGGQVSVEVDGEGA